MGAEDGLSVGELGSSRLACPVGTGAAQGSRLLVAITPGRVREEAEEDLWEAPSELRSS